MHIIIGVITALAGLVWALYRLQNSGVDLNSFNPFYWLRRRKWEKQLGIKTIHQLDNPLDAAALLITAVATFETSVTRDLRNEVAALFETEFHMSHAKAVELFSACLHMLREAGSLEAEVRPIMAPTKAKLNAQQINSLLTMLNKAAGFEATAAAAKDRIIKAVEKELEPQSKNQTGSW